MFTKCAYNWQFRSHKVRPKIWLSKWKWYQRTLETCGELQPPPVTHSIVPETRRPRPVRPYGKHLDRNSPIQLIHQSGTVLMSTKCEEVTTSIVLQQDFHYQIICQDCTVDLNDMKCSRFLTRKCFTRDIDNGNVIYLLDLLENKILSPADNATI